jgi:hypothetical protein
VPNAVLILGSYLPALIGLLCVGLTAIGFFTAAQFGMAQKKRSLVTAGWFSGALVFGGGVLVYRVFPVFSFFRQESLLPTLWWLTTCAMFYCYISAVLKDPGCVVSTPECRQAIYSAVSRGGEAEIQIQNLDVTSMVRKPLRSKHCSKTHQCVYRFDHYCIWTGNAIGGGNHRYFVIYCCCQTISQVLVGIATFLYVFVDAPRADQAFSQSVRTILEYIDFWLSDAHVLVVYFLVMYNTFVFFFVASVVVVQLWYAARNVTSNEVWFPERYKWMIVLGRRAYSYFDQGAAKNLIDFFWSGNLCQDMFVVPPMSEYVKEKCRQHAAHVKSAAKSPGDMGAPPIGQEMVQQELRAAMSALPPHVQLELRTVQDLASKMISGNNTDVEVPNFIPEPRRIFVYNQAKMMYNHLKMMQQQQPQLQQQHADPELNRVDRKGE